MSLRLTSSALALMASAMPALADVTPEEVWQSWLDYYQASGYTVTEGSRDLAGETLTLKDVKLDMAAEGVTASIIVPEVTLQATGDGKVRSVYAGDIAMKTTGKIAADAEGETAAEAEEFSFAAVLSMPGNETVTSGSKEDMTNVSTLPTMKLSVDMAPEAAEGEAAVTSTIVMTNSVGTMHVVTEGEGKYDTAMTSEKAEVTLNASGEGEGTMTLSGVIADIELTGELVGMAAMAEAQNNMAAALNKGLSIDGKVKAGKTDFTFDFDKPAGETEGDAAQSAKGSAALEGFDLAVSMSKDGLGYQVNSDKSTAELTSSDLPFPVTYGMEGTSFDVQFPVSQSDEPAPFKVAYSVNGLTIGDAIWDLFDPSKQLPRDPASIDVDVTGSLKVLKDLLDPSVMEASAEDMDTEMSEGEDMAEYTPTPSPIEPIEVTINQIAISAVGAKVSASGTLAPSEDGGMDAPVGTINARYEGVNGLMDKLGAMGLIPQDQIAGFRMMLAMFARPGDGEDVLSTELEFKEDGSVFANGQQVK